MDGSIQWSERWVEGNIDIIRPDGSLLGVIPFVALNGVVLEQTGVQTMLCDGDGEVVSENNEPQILPTTPPRIIPTPTPFLVGTLTISSTQTEGVRFAASQAGQYIFHYKGGAYSTYSLDRIPENVATWATALRIFRNEPVMWNGNAISDDSFMRFVDYGWNFSSAEAESKAQGQSMGISLLQGEYLTFATVDSQPDYTDNYGAINLEVYFIPLQ